MNYAIKDAADVTLFRKQEGGTKVPVLFTDYANSTSLEFSSDRVYATAKGANKVVFDSNKSGTFSLELQVFDTKWLSILLGAVEDESVKEYAKREVLTVAGGKVTLSETPKAGSIAMFTVETDLRSHKAEITDTAVTGADVTINAGATDGDKVVVYYLADTAAAVKSFKVTDSNYPEAYVIHGDAMLKNELGTEEFVQLRIPNCRPQGNFNISFSSSDIATLTATFDILADENGDMCEFIYIQ